MRVLVSAYACNPEGSLQLHPGEDLTGWKLVEQLSRYHELWVLTHRYNQKGIEEVNKTLPRVRFVFIELPQWLKWLYSIEFSKRIYYYLWQIKVWRVAKALHEDINFDVAHHVTFGNYWIGSFIGAFLPVPFIWGPVGGGQRTPKELLKEFTLYGILAEKFRDLAQWSGLHLLLSRRICLKRAKAVLVCNRETKNNIPKKFANKVFLFPVNGVSREDLSPSNKPRKNKGVFRVITTGRFVRLKGFTLAVHAFKLFSDQFPDTLMEIVGGGPEERHIKDLCQALGIRERVFFQGWRPRTDVLKRMRAADVFIFPSFRDGGGAVVVEAMASGLPVIVLDSGGPGFHVDSAWGIKIEPGPPDAVVEMMAEALKKLFLDTPLRERLGRAGRERAEGYYLWDRLGEQLQTIYAAILHPRSDLS